MDPLLAFYRSPGQVTGLGSHARLADALPADIAGIRDAVQGLLLHVFWAERHGVKLFDERKAEVNLRRVDRQLSRLLAIDPSPLDHARPVEHRLVGNCRDFSTIMAARTPNGSASSTCTASGSSAATWSGTSWP